MVFEQLLQSGVCYAYLMRMLGAVLPTHYSLLCTKEGSTLVLLSLYFIRAYAAYHRPQKKKHPYTCVCAVFVVSLCPNFKINNPANGSQDERSPGKEKARK